MLRKNDKKLYSPKKVIFPPDLSGPCYHDNRKLISKHANKKDNTTGNPADCV